MNSVILIYLLCGIVIGAVGFHAINRVIRHIERPVTSTHLDMNINAMEILNTTDILPFNIQMYDHELRFVDKTSNITSIVPIAYHDKVNSYRYAIVSTVLAIDHWHRCYHHADNTTLEDLREAVTSAFYTSYDIAVFNQYRDIILRDSDKILTDYETYI